MEFFSNNYGELWFINSNPNTKCPCDGYKKYNLTGWNGKKGKNGKKAKKYLEDILSHFKDEYDPEISYGIKHGLQPNGSITLGLDFDIIGKNGNDITHNTKTEEIFNEFISLTCAGVWASGTDGNYGCLCLVNSEKIKQKIIDLKQDKIEVDGVELLFETHHILPPSKSKCKKTGALRARSYMNDYEKICYVNDGDEVEDFILNLMNTYKEPTFKKSINKIVPTASGIAVKNTKIKTVKIQKNKIVKTTPIWNSLDDIQNYYNNCKTDEMIEIMDYLNILDSKYYDDYNYWMRVGWALRNTNKKYFVLWMLFSMKSSKFNIIDIAGYKENWDTDMNDGDGLSMKTIYNWCKESNATEYNKLVAKYNNNNTNETDETDDEPVMCIMKLQNLQSNYEDPELAEKLKMYDMLNKKEQKKIDEMKKMFMKKKKNLDLAIKQEYFEKYHFKVMKPPCYGRVAYGKTSLVSLRELNLMYENVLIDEQRFTDIWRKSIKIKTFENVDFLPYPCEVPEYTFNTFTGLTASKIQRKNEDIDFSIFLKHMKILTGHDEKGYNYLLKYLAHLVQRPGELPRTALVFKSKQGVGKNIFFECFGNYLIGRENTLQTAEMEKVIGRFSMINNKLLVIMDEANGKDSFSNSDKIKNIITAEDIAWERKGIDGVKINNCGRYLIFSNNDTPVMIEMSDRRFVVYICADDVRNNREYFKELYASFKDEQKVRAFYDYLKSIDVSDWDSINDRPLTKAYKNIQSANIPVIARFLEYFVDNCKNSKDENDYLFNGKRIECSALFKLFSSWCIEQNMKVLFNTTKFGRALNDYNGISRAKFQGIRGYAIDIDVLYKHLKDNGYIEDIPCIDESLNCGSDTEEEDEY